MIEERYAAGVPLEQRIPVGAVEVSPHEHEWAEAYRYLPFGPDAGEPADTDEPPKNGDGAALVLHDQEAHGEFDAEQHYRVGTPGPEIVETCAVCTETRVRPIKAAAYRGFLKRIEGGELQPEHVSLLPLERLLGDDWEKAA